MSDPIEDFKESLRKLLDHVERDPAKLSMILDELERDREVRDFFFTVKHPMLQRNRFLTFLYMIIEMFLSAIFLILGLLFIIPTSEQEFQSVIASFISLLSSVSIRGTRLLAFFLGLALLIMSIMNLSDVGESMRVLGLVEEEGVDKEG